MLSIARAAVAALAVLTLSGARAEEPAHPAQQPAAAAAPHACLNQKERRAAIESGKLVRLAAAIHTAKKRMPGTVVRARLCREADGLAYVLTMLARDGKVARLTVDATKGTLIGQR
jgi:uncharacterized membrane protein YkoI